MTTQKNILKKTGLLLTLAGVLAVPSAAAEKFVWKENFRNYNDNAPGITNESGSVGNDPIWAVAAELNFRDKSEKERISNLYDQAVAIPNLKDVTISFSYRILNATEPVVGKPEVKDKNGKVKQKAVAPVAGVPKHFTVSVNGCLILIGSDFVDVNKKRYPIPFLPNWKWEYAAIQVKDGKLTVYTGIDRKLEKVVSVPFGDGVRAVNFMGKNGNDFSITDIVIEEKGQLFSSPRLLIKSCFFAKHTGSMALFLYFGRFVPVRF